LTALLEGHPDIFSFASWHDNIAPGLGDLSLNPPDDMVDRNLVLWRLGVIQRLLWARTSWHMLEVFARQGFVPYSVSFSRRINLPFDFDFYAFTRDVTDGFVAHEHLDAQMIFSIIFTALFKRMYPMAAMLPRHAVSEGAADFYRFPLLAGLYPEGKIIYIARDIEAAYFSYLSRGALLSGRNFFEQLRTILGRQDRVTQIIRSYQASIMVETMAAEQPNAVYIVAFEELILNTGRVMRDLCTWLGVEYLPCLRWPTWFGKLVSPAVIGVINDDFKKFSRTEDAVLLNSAFATLRDAALVELQGHG
jgi:hypothetical protein